MAVCENAFLGYAIWISYSPISIKDLMSECDQHGSNMRTAFVEIDMMQGTAFPPNDVFFNNRNHTLQDIYLRSGIILDVRLDENNVPNLAGPNGTYSDGELHSLMTSHKNPAFQETGSKMSAYLVVVTNYDDVGVLGIMFDSDARLGCAVFHNESLGSTLGTVGTDTNAFLRTSAHELGHEFNLHHEDGTTYSEGGITKFSVMNQTGRIMRSSSGWPNGIGFIFMDNETRHLSTHEINNVKPGGGAFYACNSEHSSWHTGITVAD